MSERLTDERLAELADIANLRLSEKKIAEGYRLDGHMALLVRDSAAKEHFAALTAELRARRAADLTSEDAWSLRLLAMHAYSTATYDAGHGRAVLDRLLATRKP